LRNRNRSESRNNGSDDKKRNDDRRGGDRRRPYEDEKRPIDERRRQVERRPLNDDRRFTEERRFKDNGDDFRRGSEGRRTQFDDRRKVPEQQSELDERKPIPDETISDEKLIPRGSIFDRARPPPRVSRPVPLSEKNKYAYKASEKPVLDDNYNSYDYDDVPQSNSPSSTSTSTTTTTTKTTAKSFFQKLKSTPSQTTSKTTTTLAAQEAAEYYDDEYYDTAAPTEGPIESSSIIMARDERYNPQNSRVLNENVASLTTPSTTTTAASSPDSFRLNRYKNDNSRESIQSQYIVDATTKKTPSIISNANNVKKYANKQTVFDNPVTQETPKAGTQSSFQDLYKTRNLDKGLDEQPKGVVRVVKRPFLPSRGGDPYKARGLQPVGNLAYTQQSSGEGQKVTLEDLYNEEYDVDLNDALNPMLKPLTSSRGVSGFSFSSLSNNQPIESRMQSQKVIQRAEFATPSTTTTSTVPPSVTAAAAQPEYYDEEIEYTYADDEPSS
jgi:zinc finger CCCH domain-containing protein 13